LPVSRPRPGSEPVHLLVDSTGLKLCWCGRPPTASNVPSCDCVTTQPGEPSE
jgi:hypothetical protein